MGFSDPDEPLSYEFIIHSKTDTGTFTGK
jgi:hypothetical protein